MATASRYAAKKDTDAAFKDVFGKTVEEFDKEFFVWLDAKLAKFRYRFPPTETVTALTIAANASKKDAAAKLAFALLRRGKAKDAETLMSIPRERLYSAASETQNWIALGGVLQDTDIHLSTDATSYPPKRPGVPGMFLRLV